MLEESWLVLVNPLLPSKGTSPVPRHTLVQCVMLVTPLNVSVDVVRKCSSWIMFA